MNYSPHTTPNPTIGPRASTAVGSAEDRLARLALVIESRKPSLGGDPETSYISRLMHKGSDAILKKIGEEATELVMAFKDADVADGMGAAQRDAARTKVVAEAADLWFHTLIALAHHGLSPSDVVDELARREGQSGIEEKALRKVLAREASERAA